MSEPEIVELDAIDCRLEQRPWRFAEENAEAIRAHWQKVIEAKPASFNGKILLLHRWQIMGRRFSGAYLMTDYASFLAWRDFGMPGEARWNCFAMAALEAADGAFLLGEMAEHTSNAGAIYFAAGTPDPSDLDGDIVNLAGSVTRELQEETGVTTADVEIASGWTAVFHGPRIALMKSVRSPLSSVELKDGIERFLAEDERPELERMHVVASPADIRADRMPAFQCAYLAHRLDT
ncbi:NUDIX hydrolase [Labrys portucalensis]|uniref:NUDIX hydrolase n=1 Tax=Labrys neptuniae TaxID=376174 RepID=A0ABV6Z7U7_9HYPH|nr:NUDIX hydrolase [Labrys neptuniae]MDT3382396.1 NUDIX hydrolase [Labrys neptuniae]